MREGEKEGRRRGVGDDRRHREKGGREEIGEGERRGRRGLGRLSSAWVLRSMSVGHERSAALVFLFALFFLSLAPALTHTPTLIHRFCFVDLPHLPTDLKQLPISVPTYSNP